ncbi:MAG: hypothetical protein DRP47_01810 [Candidatus Zixiibacteriota bacterium]|nr:MAG: hypothetical protein DRP47_01810 [candidate division Zixibacteria bacterium]
MSPARFRWGLVLVLLGVLLLLQNANILNSNFWADLLIWFPVVLIAVGVEKIFAKSKVKFISYLTSVGLFVGGLAIAFVGSYGGEETSFFNQTSFEFESDPNVQQLNVVLDLNGTDLTIRDSGPDLVYGEFDEFTRKPRIDSDIDGKVANVKLASRSGSFLGGAIHINTGDPQDWSLRFSRDVPLELECNSSESDLHLNMSTTPLRRLKLNTDDARVYLKLGDLFPLVDIDITGEDSDLRLRIPQTVGVRILGDDYQSYLTNLGFVEDDGRFVTEGYDTTKTRIDIKLDNNLESFSVDFF